ncbi:MAG: hypothetical protein AAF604_06670 [Acidobacteriota bacterium]
MGGSAHLWQGDLAANIVAGSALLIDLTMSKLDPPNVTIAYELRVEAANGIFADGFESGNLAAWSATVP